MAEISTSMATLSETRKPPVSSAAFQVRPKSAREMVVEPSKPTRTLPKGSFAAPWYSSGRVMERVVSLMVRLPTYFEVAVVVLLAIQ